MPGRPTLRDVTGGEASAGVWLGVLGPLQAQAAGRPLRVSSRRERAVLEALALAGTRGMQVGSLVEAVWGEEPPANARKVLQTYVARLRKLLPAGTIESDPDGYHLAGTVTVDVVNFAAAARAGARRPATNELEAALGQWRGEPFPDLADSPLVTGERARLGEVRRGLQEDLLDAMLSRGEHGEAVGVAEAAVADEPLRERRWGQLMTALFRCGRQAEALRAYQRCRQILIDELGVEPGTELRALEKAVLAHDESLSAPLAAAPVPSRLPVALEEAARRPLVGRHDQLAELESGWSAVRDGARATVVLTGEPGAGKTRVAAALAARVVETDAAVLYGRCLPELGVPYQPIAEALGADILTAREVDADAAAHEQYELFGSLRDDLAARAAASPVLVIVDDVHWATTPTWRLLAFLAAAPELARVLLLLTTRAAVSVDLGPLALTSRLVLGPLAVEESIELVAARAPGELGEAERLHTLAGGNPFLIEQLLLDRQAEQQGGGARASRAADVVANRIRRLSTPTRDVLQVAALAGADFGVDLVLDAVGGDTDSVLAALEEAEADGVIVPAGLGRFAFSHALVRSVLTESMPATRRLRLHRDLATALESRSDPAPDLPALARHFAGCAPLGFGADAVRYNLAAGDTARATAAMEEAAAFYSAARDALVFGAGTGEETRCDLLIRHGEALRRTGDPNGWSLLDEAVIWARRRGDGERLGAAALALNRVGLTSDLYDADTMPRLVEEALALLGDGHPGLRARLLAVLAAELNYLPDADRRLEASTTALALARELDDDEILARVLIGCLAGWAVPEDLPGRGAMATELARLAHSLASDELACRAYRELGLAAIEACDIDGFRSALDEVAVRTAQLRQPVFDWELAYMRAADLQLTGDLDAADQLAMDAADIGRRAGVSPLTLDVVRLSLQCCLRWDQGRLPEIHADLQRIAGANPSSPFRFFLPMVYIEGGDPERARADLRNLAANRFADVPRRQTWPLTIAMAAEAAASLHETDIAATLHALLLPYNGRLIAGETFRYTLVDRVLGRVALALGHLDESNQLLAAAAEQAHRLEAPGLHARVLIDQARLATVRGDTASAHRCAREGAGLAARTSADGIVAAADDILNHTDSTRG